jgi:hypothetical protein
MIASSTPYPAWSGTNAAWSRLLLSLGLITQLGEHDVSSELAATFYKPVDGRTMAAQELLTTGVEPVCDSQLG